MALKRNRSRRGPQGAATATGDLADVALLPGPDLSDQADWDQSLARLVYSLRDVAVAACDTDMQVTAYSPAFRDLVGRDIPRDLATVERDIIAVDETGRRLGVTDWPLARALRGETVRDAMLQLVRADGSDLFVRCDAAACQDAAGRVVGAILLVQDVSEEYLRQRHDTELRERLIETINHEFRTPLSAVLGHAELLEDMRLELPPAAQQFLSAVVDGARRLHVLTEEVSELVDLHDAQDLVVRAGDLSACVRREIDAVRRYAETRDVRVEATLPATLVVRADLGLVGRAVAALLRGAVERAPEASCVSVSVTHARGRAVVEVAHTGAALAESQVALLEKPFPVEGQEADRPASKGLVLARTVAEAHGGTVRIRPNQPQGVRVALVLPLTPPGAHAAAAAPHRATSRATHRSRTGTRP